MKVINISTIEARRELLAVIKRRIKVINNGDVGEPVYLKNVRISSKAMPWVEGVSFTLTAVFCDEKGILRGDLAENSKAIGSGIMFGQNIENMGIDHLTKILAELGGDEEPKDILKNRPDRFFSGILKKISNG